MIIQENISLLAFNTFRINVFAKFFVEVKTIEELQEILESEVCKNHKLFVLGGGSNLLLTENFDGLVIRMGIKGIKTCEEKNDIYIEAGAAEVWNEFVGYCVDHQYAGLENLTLIPGTVGASPIQNIGAYGVEIKDTFYSLVAVEISTGKIKTFTKEDCQFSYRDSIFKNTLRGQFIITSVTFKLAKNSELILHYGAIESELQNRGILKPTIKEVSDVVAAIRVAKLPDPSTIGNSGSFFKNPIISKIQFEEILRLFPDIIHYPATNNQVKLAAGWMIESCGWKGKRIGDAGTWENQSLVIVNHGSATGKDIFDFSSKIIDSVRSKFGVSLEREVNIL